MATRWGICSAGLISQDFTSVLLTLPSEEHKVVAVGARKLQSAQDFAKKYDIPKAHGSYEELAKDPNVDVVYIGTIHPTHAELSMMMLHAGKHVLCEKPMCMNAKEARQVLQLAKEKQLFFMEAFWSRFFPVYDQLRKELDAGSIGEPTIVTANFGVSMGDKGRIVKKELGGGALLDVGCYTVQLAELVFKDKPEKIIASGFLGPTGVDQTVTMTLCFSHSRLAVLTCSTNCESDRTATICGSKGIIKMPDFWCPTEIITPFTTCKYPLPDKDTIHTKSMGFMYEASAVRQCIQKGETESELMTHSSSLAIMEILDEARRQLGLVYDADQ